MHFTRIEKVLEYIHHHLFLSLSLEDLAQKSCWSRWQLQRVFTAATGVNVAQYVREIKLSKAAENLIDTPNERIVDIALSLGFNSEISFSRSFKQFFGCSPRDYRKRGIRTGLRQPLTRALNNSTQELETSSQLNSQLSQIRIEHKDAFQLMGCRGEIRGIFDPDPNFQQSVPEVWQQLDLMKSRHLPEGYAVLHNQRFGVIDTVSQNNQSLTYWATEPFQAKHQDNFSTLTIPEQEYAVLSHKGEVVSLKFQLEWFFTCWLPQSGYTGVDGYELEIYPEDYDSSDPDAYMEYWLPVVKSN
ncbi:MAG: helix-turn-helix domain-containing protein [Vibrio sp.]